MLERLARVEVRHKIPVLLGALMLMVLAVALGGGVVDQLSSGGFTDSSAESSRADRLLRSHFAAGEPNFVLLVTAPTGGNVDDPEVARSGAELSQLLAAEPGVDQATSYWTHARSPALRSDNGRSALILAQLAGDENQVKATAGVLGPEYRGKRGSVTVGVGGSAEVYRQMSQTIQDDLQSAEARTLPRTWILLVLVFGGALAALLPVAIGIAAITGTLLLLLLLTTVTDVSVFSLNLITALGLGLSIDYSLLIVTRYREELRAGSTVDDAIVHTVGTSGRTVVYSAVTVAMSLATLLVFPLPLLRSFAYAGVAITMLATAGALVVLPALLALIGHRIDALSPPRLAKRLWTHGRQTASHHRARHKAPRLTGWSLVASAVVARPVRVGAVGVILLLALGIPFHDVQFGLNDYRSLPAGKESRQVGDALRTEFGGREADALFLVSSNSVPVAQLSPYAARLSTLPDVARVDTATASYVDGAPTTSRQGIAERPAHSGGTWIQVVPDVEGYSPEGQRLARALRAAPAPAPMLLGGPSARLVDTSDALSDRLPLALGLIALSVGLLLFLFTGSVLIPVKALLLNLLSLSATFGAMVWVFQEGHLRWLVGDFTVTGTLDVTMPVLMFCVAFGLSMDYEVFLLARIREEYLRTGSNRQAVVAGLARTGRIVTVAAVLMAVVFVSFAASEVTPLKLLGVGLALAVVVDATLVRAALVPAFMTLAGDANWWAPAPLRRLHARFGLHEAPVPVRHGRDT